MDRMLKQYLATILDELGINDIPVLLEHPGDLSHGDFATNVAMVGAKKAGKNPRSLAEEIVAKLKAVNDPNIAAIEIAGPGFINFTLSKDYFAHALGEALLRGEQFGVNDTQKGKKVIVEYTDPNPFKEFHIGHLMSNTIGESISRLIEASGAETKRACYQGDVGLHVAKAMWSAIEFASTIDPTELKNHFDNMTVDEKIDFNHKIYAAGSKRFEEDDQVKQEVFDLNKKIFSHSDLLVNFVYDKAREWSLFLFEQIYTRLGTKFDYYFFESETGLVGKQIVEENKGKIFEESEGAVVFHAEKYNPLLHTRVFINKEGLPTYEAKELGLATLKFNGCPIRDNSWDKPNSYIAYPYDVSIVVTGNEVNDYFQVLLCAMAQIYPDLAAKTEHYSHGMLRLPTGKMSSRTGDVITAESLIEEMKVKAFGKITESDFADEEKDTIAEQVAIGAIKYSILRQASGKDIIFDVEQSLSFEGDSGPYLQYTYARTQSLLAKAGDKKGDASKMTSAETSPLHKHILRFPEIVLRAQAEREPHYVATYLIELAREFNGFYGNTVVLDSAPDEPYKLALVTMTSHILKRGLWLLGIVSPTRM